MSRTESYNNHIEICSLYQKPKESCSTKNREHPICIENKHGNIVIDFSAAAYEYFKHALLETLHTSRYEITVTDKRDSKWSHFLY